MYPNHTFKWLWDLKDEKSKGTYTHTQDQTMHTCLGLYSQVNPSTSFYSLFMEHLPDTHGQLSGSFPFPQGERNFLIEVPGRKIIFIKVLSPTGQGPRPENSITYSFIFSKRGKQSHKLSYLSLTGMGMGQGTNS